MRPVRRSPRSFSPAPMLRPAGAIKRAASCNVPMHCRMMRQSRPKMSFLLFWPPVPLLRCSAIPGRRFAPSERHVHWGEAQEACWEGGREKQGGGGEDREGRRAGRGRVGRGGGEVAAASESRVFPPSRDPKPPGSSQGRGHRRRTFRGHTKGHPKLFGAAEASERQPGGPPALSPFVI